MWEVKWLSLGALENIVVFRWRTDELDCSPQMVLAFFLSQMYRKETEAFQLTDDVEKGLKGELSKTEDSHGVFKLSRMSSQALGWASETKFPSIHPFTHLSLCHGSLSSATHRALRLSPCLSSWLAATSQGQTPSLLDQSHSRPKGSNYVFSFPL